MPSVAQPVADRTCCIQLRAPVTGRVLRIFEENETVVPPGAPLIENGDPADLEVVADLLSTETVLVEVGALVRIDGWGGPAVRGRGARIDPAGFTKVSALGIEEHGVRAVIGFVGPQEAWSRIGHDFRVIVNITVWSAPSVLRVSVSALFGDQAVGLEGMDMGRGVSMSEHTTDMTGGFTFWPLFLIRLAVSFALGWYVALIFGPIYNWPSACLGSRASISSCTAAGAGSDTEKAPHRGEEP
jgi:hypothetical protein